MNELCCGRPCCGHQPTSGFCAQAVPINDSFLVPFLALSTCFPLLRGQESMSEVSCLCSQAVLHQSGSRIWASQSPHMLLPAHLLTQWDGRGTPQANTGAFFTLAFGSKADSSQETGESGTASLRLFASGLRAHKSCKPHLTLERYLIYAV